MDNLKFLRLAIRKMTPRQELYQVLKEELGKLGHWRNLPRGKTVKK